ncbi:hypothetical protein PGB28_10345 [Primorskyibacter aestuariivivens]|nr:hypothetical protein [Primorskyibacter aestuariivivens]MDA7428858.1 hypothetical protein [Primorskyibacter aestuariivivens]
MLFLISVSWLPFAQVLCAGCAFLGINAERDNPDACLSERRYL